MILLHDVENPLGCLICSGSPLNSLNDIVQEADSAKRNVRHGDAHIESRAHSIYIKKEEFCD